MLGSPATETGPGGWIDMTAKDRREEFPVLVVDLDGTLIRSDSLYESFWAGMADDWRTVFTALAGLARGRAALKRRLASGGRFDAAHLPYNEAVLDYVRNWRAAGGRTALVTAADEGLARKVADHLQLFDEIHGSDGRTNLKGETKARLLRERYGPGAYAYIGDSRSDLPAWRDAAMAITVDAPARLRRQVAAQTRESEHLGTRTGSMAACLEALRPHQWLKNVLVLVPVLAAHAFDGQRLLQAALAFVAFSLVASSGYLLNDLTDLRADRAHPRKSRRPLASGRVPIACATAMVPLLLLGGVGIAALAGWALAGVVAGYFALTTTYSTLLKRHAVADIGTLAALYTLRIIGGGMATELGVSVWLLAFSMFFFFSLAALKRQAELVDMARRGVNSARRRAYTVDDLPLVGQMTVASGYISVLVLALYLNAPPVQKLYSAPWLLWGICLVVMYWISRVALITHRGGMLDDPVAFAIRDRTSHACVLLVGLFMLGASFL